MNVLGDGTAADPLALVDGVKRRHRRPRRGPAVAFLGRPGRRGKAYGALCAAGPVVRASKGLRGRSNPPPSLARQARGPRRIVYFVGRHVTMLTKQPLVIGLSPGAALSPTLSFFRSPDYVQSQPQSPSRHSAGNRNPGWSGHTPPSSPKILIHTRKVRCVDEPDCRLL